MEATPAHASPLSRRLRSHMPCPLATCLRPPSPPPRRSVERPRVPLRYLEAPPKGSPGRRRSIGLTIETDVSWPPRRPTTTSDEFGGEEGDAPPLPALTRPMRAPALTLCVCVPQVEGCRASSSTSRRHPRQQHPPHPRFPSDTVLPSSTSREHGRDLGVRSEVNLHRRQIRRRGPASRPRGGRRWAAGQADGRQGCGRVVGWGVGKGFQAGGVRRGRLRPRPAHVPAHVPRPACRPVRVGRCRTRVGGPRGLPTRHLGACIVHAAS